MAATDEPDPVAALVETGTVELTDDMITRLCHDIAQDIHKSDVIARRYGLEDRAGLGRWLFAHPEVVRYAKQLRAIFHSDMAASERARLKAVYASEELVVPMAHLAGDPTAPAGLRLDAFKQLNRMAGLDGGGSASKDGQGPTGTQFTVNFMFRSGTESITTVVGAPVIEASPA